jgi:hypothetical protein
LKIVIREDDTPAARKTHQVRELRTRLDVDVFRPKCQRLGEDAAAFVLRTSKSSSFPLGSTGHHDRATAPGERASDFRIADCVEA